MQAAVVVVGTRGLQPRERESIFPCLLAQKIYCCGRRRQSDSQLIVHAEAASAIFFLTHPRTRAKLHASAYRPRIEKKVRLHQKKTALE
jgi:hypothetical protein